MSESTMPPSARRQRDARAAGLRPRSSLLGLACVAALAWAACELLAVRGPAWLAQGLTRAFADGSQPQLEPGTSALALLSLAGGLALVMVVLVGVGRRPSPRALGVSEDLGELPAPLRILGCVIALALLLAVSRPSVAASARAVDAQLHGLWLVWWGWLTRGLAGLTLVALGLGLIERLVSARLLWQGLHLTREQARERARAAGEGRR